MKIVYRGHTTEVVIPVEIDGVFTTFTARNGIPVELPKELAHQLLEQNVWHKA